MGLGIIGTVIVAATVTGPRARWGLGRPVCFLQGGLYWLGSQGSGKNGDRSYIEGPLWQLGGRLHMALTLGGGLEADGSVLGDGSREA